MTHLSKPSQVLDLFITPLFATFQPNNDDRAVMAMAQMAYAKHMTRFSPETLGRALDWFQVYRKDRFVPTIAECIEIATFAADAGYVPASLDKMISRQKQRANFSALARKLVDGELSILDPTKQLPAPQDKNDTASVLDYLRSSDSGRALIDERGDMGAVEQYRARKGATNA